MTTETTSETTFPGTDDTVYEVWECADGKPVRLACRHLGMEMAVETAATWTTEAAENAAMESFGARKPAVHKTFAAVKVTKQRTIVSP